VAFSLSHSAASPVAVRRPYDDGLAARKDSRVDV
jgi:hypothetical protein